MFAPQTEPVGDLLSIYVTIICLMLTPQAKRKLLNLIKTPGWTMPRISHPKRWEGPTLDMAGPPGEQVEGGGKQQAMYSWETHLSMDMATESGIYP